MSRGIPYFPGRELTSYGEYVKARDLVVGSPYFKVSYVDNDSAIPEMLALIYIGRDLDDASPGLYFQDASSYLAGNRYESVDWSTAAVPGEGTSVYGLQGTSFHVLPAGEYSGVLEFDKAVNVLLLCSLRRATWGQLRAIPPPPEK